MKRRILFVDDEALILQGLRRMLSPARQEWDMEFVSGGTEALAAMERQPADVVVSDMRMPGMTGAELLNRVQARWPRTVRLILSGQAEESSILQCAAATHQFLTKPCEPAVLRETLARLIRVQSGLHSGNLQQLVARLNRLPSVPSLYLEVTEKAKQPDIELDVIGDIIAREISMTAKVLHLVNSGFWGLPRKISHPTEAVAYLGLDVVRALVLSLGAFSGAEVTRLGGFSMTRLWNHSLAVATAARRVAILESASHAVRESAFVAGLLHDIGKIVLAMNFPDDYAAALAASHGGNQELRHREAETFGADHAEVGGYLLGLWGLPPPVVEAIRHHHEPSRGPTETFAAVTAVHVANAWQPVDSAPPPVRPLDTLHLQKVGVEARLAQWRDCLSEATVQGEP